MAADWGARIVEIGARGHINGESGLGDWPEGRALLASLTARRLSAEPIGRQSRPMVTKKPKGLGLGLEALLGPKVVGHAAARRATARPPR